MQRLARESGSALMLLITIIVTLAIVSAALVVVVANQQSATAGERHRKSAAYYAEAALENAVDAAKTKEISTVGEWLSQDDLAAAFADADFPEGATVTYRVYDNLATADYEIKWDQGGPTSSDTPDGLVWVEVTVTYLGKTSRMRVLVHQAQSTIVSGLPRAVLYSDTGIELQDTSDLYSVNNDGTNDISGSPFPTTVMAGTYFTANSSADLAGPGSAIQSVGIRANGAITTPGHVFADVVSGSGQVGLLSDYFDQGEQAELGDEAQAGTPSTANASGTSVAPSKFKPSSMTTIPGCTYNSGTKTYTFANDLVVSGALTLSTSSSSPFPSGTTFNFKSLYVNGALTISGNLTVNTTVIYVGGDFTVKDSTAGNVDHFGPVYASGIVTWGNSTSDAISVRTTNYKLAGADDVPDDTTVNPAGPIWAGRLHINGIFTDVIGNTWVNGGADTSNTISVVGPSSGSTYSQLYCPLMASTEQTTTGGKVNFGSRTRPMTYYMQCDNDGGYYNTCDWAANGTFYGLMVLMEARIEFSGGDGTKPCVEGAVFVGTPATSSYSNPHGDILTGSDITLTGASSAAYNQAVIDACMNNSITTTTVTTATVDGSWQQLSAQ